MAMNKFMHPRNIYKTPPDFKQLAITYPEFRRHVKQDVSGKISIDFKDIEALRALTCTLLKKDFDLEVEIPLDRMVPTVPLRLNYILWLEDLLSISSRVEDVHGVDIGTGASCIYPLLAAKINKWNMIATEVDEISFNYAVKNVQKNNLSKYIEVLKVNENSLLKDVIEKQPELTFDFCMCNPPFFASTQELQPTFKARRPDRPKPRNAFSATISETVASGGEISFISKLIQESVDIGRQVRIFTTMIGHKSSLPALKKLLRESDVVSFKQTEFCQGRTTRWALAWTYCEIDLRKIPENTVAVARKQKSKLMQHSIETEMSLIEFVQELVKLFDNLQLKYDSVKDSKNVMGFCVEASTNTWSNQRRKKRQMERLTSLLKENEETNSNDIHDTANLVANLSVNTPSPKSPNKRELESSDDECDSYFNSKKFKPSSNDNCFLKFTIVVRKEDAGIRLELSFLDGTAGVEGMHQVLQYLKNNVMKV